MPTAKKRKYRDKRYNLPTSEDGELIKRHGISPDGKERPWTNLDHDILMNLWLAGRGKLAIEKVLNRSVNGVEVKIRKLCVKGYDKNSPERFYVAENRDNRNSLPWSDRDLYCMARCLSERGRKNNTCVPTHIAMILGRDWKQVKEWLQRRFDKAMANLPKPSKGFFAGEIHSEEKRLPDESYDQFVARIVYKSLEAK